MCQAFCAPARPSTAVTDYMLESTAKDPVAGNAKLKPVLGFAKHAAAQWLSRQRAAAAQPSAPVTKSTATVFTLARGIQIARLPSTAAKAKMPAKVTASKA